MLLLNKKIKSGALQFSIFVSVLIALLILGLLLYLHSVKTLGQNSQSLIKAIENNNQAFLYELNTKTFFKDSLFINISREEKAEQIIKNEFWGTYQKTYVDSRFLRKNFKRVAFLGSKYNQRDKPALYLKNTRQPLVLVGDTKIEGLAFLPDQGVKPGNILGNAYYGNKLIYGDIKFSTSDLPKLRGEYFTYLKELTNSNNSQELLFNPENSFLESTKLIYDVNTIILDKKITGNVIVKSETQIIVKNTSDLRDIILVAPKILIENGVKGMFQAIASEEIEIKKNVTLDYPSSIILYQTNNENSKPHRIIIDANSVIKGQVVFIGDNNENIFENNIYVGMNSNIIGEIYCEGNLELKGNVYGSVYTHQFTADYGGTVYINHLFDIKISNIDFPDFYAGLPFENEKKTIAKWLY